MIQLKEEIVQEIFNATESGLVKNIIKDSISKIKNKGIKHSQIAVFVKQLEIAVLNFDRRNITNHQRENLVNAQNILTVMLIKGF